MAAVAAEESLLVLLLETNPALWEAPLPPGGADAAGVRSLGFRAVVEQVLVFVNAFLLLNAGNRLVVYAVHSDGCHLLHESPQLRSAADDPTAPAAEPAPTAAILHGLAALVAAAPGGADGAPAALPASPLAGALSRALCHIGRATRGTPLAPRILCLHGSLDAPAQYVATMNAIFCAQAAGVPIDACLLGGGESPFLQQACSLTSGVYVKPARPAALLQYLLSVFAADAGSRGALRLPQPRGVDFRASCFCHKRAVDAGFVCSVCLSIFCTPCAECSTCGTRFEALKRAGG